MNPYENFATQYPASPKVAYAREGRRILQKMIAEEAAHHPKADRDNGARGTGGREYLPTAEPGRRHVGHTQRYPIDTETKDGAKVITPVHRLVDLGDAAVPALIEALDDRRFTHCLEQSFHTDSTPPLVMRVGNVAQRILEHISGRNFYRPPRRTTGQLINGTTRQQAEAWWKEKQGKGEKEQLIEATAKGGDDSRNAARKLVEKYPDVAIAAIEAGWPVTKHPAHRGELVKIAGRLPGDTPLAFLRSKLTAGNGLYSQVHAAEALFAHGQPDAIPAMVEAWHAVQSRLLTNESDAYSEVGVSHRLPRAEPDAKAIDALAREARHAPVDARLAVVSVFMPDLKQGGSMTGVGATISPSSPASGKPPSEPAPAIERLLVSALDDRERRFGLRGTLDEASLRGSARLRQGRVHFVPPLAGEIPVPVECRPWGVRRANLENARPVARGKWIAASSPTGAGDDRACGRRTSPPCWTRSKRPRDAVGRAAITSRIADTFGLAASCGGGAFPLRKPEGSGIPCAGHQSRQQGARSADRK